MLQYAKSVMLNYIALACSAFLLTCCDKKEDIKNLGDCWNINVADPGQVKGRAFAIITEHGISLQSTSCPDDKGVNKFVLSDRQIRKLRNDKNAFSRYVYFTFLGNIYKTSSGKYLKISELRNIQYTSEEPEWIKKMKESTREAH